MYHRLKKPAIILAILLGVFVGFFTFYHEVYSAALTKQQPSIANCYETFPGEEIPLNNQKNNTEGTWGNLELQSFILQPTADFIRNQTNTRDLYDMFESSRQWTFNQAKLEDIRLLFLNTGLSEKTSAELLANTRSLPNGQGYVTTPPDAVLWNFTPEIRAKLYPLIGKYPDNTLYSDPVSFNSGTAEEWFYNSNLSPEIAMKLSPLVYQEEGVCYISDIHSILPLLSTETERDNLLQTLYRTKALDVYLVIKEGEDVHELVNYWGNLGRVEDIKPILERASHNPGGEKINIAELLPFIPQHRLNTYSGLEEYETDFKDCHWTTINFFNNYPDEAFSNFPIFQYIKRISQPSYNSQLKFGDIISIFDNNGLTHSCTYIAGNLVYTKNGMGNLKPFVITNLDKTIPLYGNKTVYRSRTVINTLNLPD